MKRDKIILNIIILNIIILSIIILILSGCVTPTAPNIPDQGDGINHNPIISDLFISPRTAFIDQNVTITCTASDQDGDTLTYGWSSSTSGTITGSSSTITWITPATEGTYTITCMVSDGKGGKDNKSVDIIVAVNGVKYQIPWSKAESNGWANPLGEGKELITSTAYDYDSGIYLHNHPGKKHMGIDTDGNEENDDVYPIARGTIRRIVRGSDPMNMVIIIEHTNSNNEYFFAIYGHVLAREDLREGIMVCKNIKLGDIKTAGSGPHLHFGINTSSEISDFYYGIYGWGRIPDFANPSDYGWVDSIDYLNTHKSVHNLPIYRINIKMYTGSESYFNIEFKNIGFGYDIYDGIWIGWCADSETTIETNEWYQGYTYCSYSPPNRYNIDWPKINWIINNKDSYSADYIQNAIWHFTNGFALNGLAIAAETHSNFCPQPGQKYIAIIDVTGKQLTFIEVSVNQ
jgi:hypothetical protein